MPELKAQKPGKHRNRCGLSSRLLSCILSALLCSGKLAFMYTRGAREVTRNNRKSPLATTTLCLHASTDPRGSSCLHHGRMPTNKSVMLTTLDKHRCKRWMKSPEEHGHHFQQAVLVGMRSHLCGPPRSPPAARGQQSGNELQEEPPIRQQQRALVGAKFLLRIASSKLPALEKISKLPLQCGEPSHSSTPPPRSTSKSPPPACGTSGLASSPSVVALRAETRPESAAEPLTASWRLSGAPPVADVIIIGGGAAASKVIEAVMVLIASPTPPPLLGAPAVVEDMAAAFPRDPATATRAGPERTTVPLLGPPLKAPPEEMDAVGATDAAR